MNKTTRLSRATKIINPILLLAILIVAQVSISTLYVHAQGLSTAILDDFNRADGSVGTNWSGTTSGYSTASNRLDVGSGSTIFWGTQFGSDQEVFVTLTAIDPNGSEQDLLLKSQSATTWSNGVIEVWYDVVNKRVQVWTYSGAQGWVQRGADISVTMVNGDRFGARAKPDGIVEVYQNGTLLASRDTSGWTYSANNGYIGFWFINSSNAILDDFGGGTVAAGSTSTSTATQPPLPSSTLTPTSISTLTPVVTSSPTFTPTRTSTATSTSTNTRTFTPTYTPTFTPVGASTSTFTSTPTRTLIPASTSTNTPTFTPTYTPVRTATNILTGVFPSTGILDNFNRSNGSLGPNWGGATSGYSIVTNYLDVGKSGGSVLWTTRFGTDQEVFVTLTTVDPNGSEQDLLLKSQSATTWSNGVIKVLYNAPKKSVQVWTYSSAQGWVQRGTSISVTFANGDRFGARARTNGIVEIYRNSSLIGSLDASGWTYTANNGYIGFWFISSRSSNFDDFGGGMTAAPAATNTPLTPTPTTLVTTTSTRTPTLVLTNTPTMVPTSSLTPVFTATKTPTNIPTNIPTSTSTPSSIPTFFFPVGTGGSDVIPHQIVRTHTDHLYLFTNVQSSSVLRVYRTTGTGLPTGASAFAAPIQITESSLPIGVDAVYDGSNIIHMLTNLQNGQVKDYPFDVTTNTFKAPIILATDGGNTGGLGMYVGTGGLAGMVDLSGNLQIAYWTTGNHILQRTYSYNSTTNTLTPAGNFIQVDTAGSANHPVVAVSPFDNSLTVAWVSQADNPPTIRTRTRASDGTWGIIQSASTASVWTSATDGINIDQGPSLIIDSAGTKHLTYMQSYEASVGNYGRIHYVRDTGSGWVDQALNAFTHDPVLAINSAGEMYIIGHGHPANVSCTSMYDMCVIKKNTNGTWGDPQLFAAHTGTNSFDSSASVKWSAVGFNRPETIEFVFFMIPYANPTLYYGRLP